MHLQYRRSLERSRPLVALLLGLGGEGEQELLPWRGQPEMSG
jgi:hypothetical protein